VDAGTKLPENKLLNEDQPTLPPATNLNEGLYQTKLHRIHDFIPMASTFFDKAGSEEPNSYLCFYWV